MKSRLLRLIVAATLLAGAWLVPAQAALADHCEPQPAPKPIEQDVWWCHTPQPTPTPVPTPEPTPEPQPEPEPEPAPTPAPAPTTPRPATPGPTQTPFQIEVPEEPQSTPEILVDPFDTEQQLEVAEQASSVSNWIFGFIVGFIIGGLAGRASWGLRRRRRDQIFG